jgi:hypothetical protein
LVAAASLSAITDPAWVTSDIRAPFALVMPGHDSGR